MKQEKEVKKIEQRKMKLLFTALAILLIIVGGYIVMGKYRKSNNQEKDLNMLQQMAVYEAEQVRIQENEPIKCFPVPDANNQTPNITIFECPSKSVVNNTKEINAENE